MTGREPDPKDLSKNAAWSQRSADIVEHLPVGVLLWHLEDLSDINTFRLLGANPASSEATGYPMLTFVGKTMPEAFPALYATPLPRLYLDAIRTGKTQEFPELEYGDDHVVKGTYTVKAIPLSDQCVVVLFENITERKKLEIALDGALHALLQDRKKKNR